MSCTPGALGFKEVQKDCMRQVSFAGILNMKMTEVPCALSCFVLNNFNSETKKTVLQKGVIYVTKESVFSTNKADMNFRMNLIALLIKSLIKSSSSGKSNTNPFNYIKRKTKISNIDRCSYLIDCLVKNKQSFDPSIPTSNFNGPCAYLVFLYLDRIKSDVFKLGDFGTGDFNDEFVEEELNEEEVVMIKYRKLDMLIEDGINKFPENITLNHLKICLDAIFKDKNEDNQEKKLGMMMFKITIVMMMKMTMDIIMMNQRKRMQEGKILKEENENVKGGEEQQGKNKDERGEDIEISAKNKDGEEVETDNNDQCLDDMNLHDKGVKNEKVVIIKKNKMLEEEEKGIIGEEPQTAREGVEGKNIEGNNPNKGEGRTGEETQIGEEGVEGKNLEGMNVDKGKGIAGEEPHTVRECVEGNNIGKNLKGMSSEKGKQITGEEQNSVREGTIVVKTKDVNKTITNYPNIKCDEVNYVYEKTLKEYKEKKEKSMMPSYDLNIRKLTPPEMAEVNIIFLLKLTIILIIIYELQNTGEEEKDKGKKEVVVKDVPNQKKGQLKIKFVISKNQNKESLPEVTEKKNITQQHRQQRKKKPSESMRSPYKERAICLKTKINNRRKNVW
uniref:Uncharacterized protein n=1 Tax=Lactuca sativa TaxID=4236 RepID=A0A9R1X703_LACSA|nr:hypothetical protein LSAT_V11C600326830 [Lactuca sativa]